MTKTKSAKRALLMSALSLLLCVSMLVGSTFAWFTDSVTSAGNIIKSGTLDVEMYWANGTEAVNSANWKDASTGAIFNYDKWEPGYVEVRHIKIANEGTLALKYQLNIIANGEVSDLADVIDVYYVDPAVQVADRTQLTSANKLGTLTEVLAAISTTASGNLLAGENHTVTLALKMQENAGNEYQNKAIGTDFSVQLLATQLTSETDSFDNQYDADAPHTLVTTADELVAAVAEGGLIMLKEDIELSDILVVNKPGTVINGDGNTLTSTAGRAINISGADGVTITDLTIECSGERAINVIQNSTNVVIDNVTATASNYTVNVAASAGAANVAVSNSTITGLNAINVAGAGAYVTVDNSVVNSVDNSSDEGYSAICLNKDAANGTIIVTDTQINITGTNTNGSFVAHNEADNGYISIDGSTDDVVVAVAYISYGDNYYSFESLEEAIEKATDKDTVVLIRDIELTEGLTVAADKTITIDLKGHTISQSKACTASYAMITNRGTLTINDSVGGGKVSFTDTGAGDPNFGWGSYTIANYGTLLTINGGTIEHLGEQNPGNGQPNVHMYCAIWQYSGSTVINGGTISTPTYRSARLWKGDMTINGGNFVGQLWVQCVDDNANLTINGGTFAPCGNDGSSVYVSNGSKTAAVSITGGTFTTKIGMANALQCVTGGTFAVDPTAYVANGYIAVENADGTYTVVEIPKAATEAELIAAISDGGVVQLTDDIALSQTLLTKKDVTIDLNGHSVSSTGTSALFQSQSNAAPSMIITSSKDGAVINAGGNAVLLGYGSTEISNVTINVDTIKSSNYTTFKVYGDLTLGEGTVVNVDYLGTSLISNNAAAKIVIDGAEINVDTFKVNGGAMISINQATTVEMSNTEVNVGLDTTYTSYFVSQENKATISDCTFNIEGTDSVTYTVSETGKQWVAN